MAKNQHQSSKNKSPTLSATDKFKKYNEDVKKNIKVMKQIIDTVLVALVDYEDCALKFDSIIKLLNFSWDLNPGLRNHWLNQNYFSTEQSFLNLLLDCIKEELIVFMEKEISKCQFFSSYCDDLQEITGTNHCALSIRLVDEQGDSQEYFLGFFELTKERSPKDMVSLLVNNLKLYDVNSKLIAYTCDGTSVTTGQQTEFQNLMLKTLPKSLYCHCFSRPLNSLIKQCCAAQVPEASDFFLWFEGIIEFLPKLKPYNISLLEEILENNFELSECLDLISFKHISFISTQQNRFLNLFQTIISSGFFGAELICKAKVFSEKLMEQDFNFYLSIFKDIFMCVEALESDLLKCFQGRNFSKLGLESLSRCMADLNMKTNDLVFLGHMASLQSQKGALLELTVVNSYKANYNLIIDIVAKLLSEKFSNFEKFDFMQLSDAKFNGINSYNLLDSFCKTYGCEDSLNKSNLYFEFQCLMDTDRIIFNENNLQDLVKKMFQNKAKETIPTVYNLYSFLLTLPLSDKDEKKSCYRRVQNYFKNQNPTENLFSPYALLFIEQDTLKKLKGTDNFYDSVISRFRTCTAGFPVTLTVPLVPK